MTVSPQACLEDVLITGEIGRRKPRRPDHAAENRALVTLAREMSDRPRQLLQRLLDIAVELCHAGSAGISLLKSGGDGEYFLWEALSGVYAPYVGGTTPRGFSPCGTTLERNAPQLFFYPARYFTYFGAVEPPIVEGLVIPLYAQGRPLGTIWIVSHDEDRRFDAEDVRIITSLGEFTSAAFHLLSSLDAATEAHREADRATAELQEADRRKDTFLATLAHELRNPLAPIRNSLHLLRFAAHDDSVRERALTIVERQTGHLIRLVDDLLEVSRITRGKLELRRERIELSRVVQSAVETSRPLIETSTPPLHRGRVLAVAPETDEQDSGSCEDGEPDGDKPEGDDRLLPPRRAEAGRGDGRHGLRAQCGGGERHRPVPISTPQSRPVRRRAQTIREPDLGPGRAQRQQEGAVHHSFQMGGEPHARIPQRSHRQPGQEAKKKQRHSVPQQRASPVLHGSVLEIHPIVQQH